MQRHKPRAPPYWQGHAPEKLSEKIFKKYFAFFGDAGKKVAVRLV
jgi:hypothetical protein